MTPDDLLAAARALMQRPDAPTAGVWPRAAALPTGFIHLPFLPSMVSAHAREEPSMDLPVMIRALEIALARVGGAAG